MKSEVLSVKEKIGYGMGDAASHIIFDNVMLYMMFFYTDIFGIPAGFVGTMFLVARALDAISDPCILELTFTVLLCIYFHCFISAVGAVWRTAIRDRLCTGL